MATTTNYGWDTPDDTDLVKDGAAAIRTLGSSIDTSFAADEGDLLVGGTSDIFEALPIGAAGTVLTSDGDTAEWATPAGSTKSFALLNVGGTSLSGSTTTISSLSGYDQFMVLLADTSGTSNAPVITVRFNADTGSNYSIVGSVNQATQTYDPSQIVNRTASLTANSISLTKGAAQTADRLSCAALFIHGANSSGVKVYQALSGAAGSDNYDQQTRNFMGAWNNSAVISSISFIINAGDFDAGTVFIYGAV